MSVGFSTVTVVTDERRVDLALPSDVPVGEWFPELLRLCSGGNAGGSAGWVLGQVGGPQIGLDSTLAAAGVSDGQVLQLRAADSDGFVAYVDDFVDSVSDRVDNTGDRWTNATSTSFTAVVAAGGLLALLYPAFTRGSGGWLFCLVVAAAVSLAGAMWARRERTVAATVLAVTALVWWANTGLLLGQLLAGGLVAYGMAAVWLAIGGGVLRVAAAGLAGPAAFSWMVAALVVVSGVPLAFGVPAVPVMCALLLLCVLIFGVLPLTALGAGGLAAMDYRIRAGQRLSNSAIDAAVSRASGTLTWTLLAVGGVGAVVATAIAMTTGTWPRLLAALTGAAFLLRSRAYTRRAHAMPLRLAGAAVLAATAGRFVLDGEPGVVLVVVFAAGLIALALLSAVPVNTVLNARLRLLGNYAEVLTVVVLVPVLAHVFGVFAWVRDLIGT